MVLSQSPWLSKPPKPPIKMPISEESFLASLKRIERQYGGSRKSRIPGGSSVEHERTIKQPPDEASYNVGKGLARSFLELTSSNTPAVISKEVQNETISLLADRATNPAVCHGFFYVIAEAGGGNDDLDLEDFLATCILFTEQVELQEQNHCSNNYGDDDDDCGTHFGPLTCMIRAYAKQVRFECEQDVFAKASMQGEAPSTSSCVQKISRTYSKLETQACRLAMLREFTDVAFMRPKQQQKHAPQSIAGFHQLYTQLLNPLLACTIISPKEIESTTVESMLCLEGIWRQVEVLIEDVSTTDEYSTHFHSLLDVTVWLTNMLDLYLLSITSQKQQQRIVSKEFAKRWLAFVLDVGFFVGESFEHDGDKEQQQALLDWFEGILSRTFLRWFSIMPSYRVSMRTFWVSLQKLMDIFASQSALSLEPTLKLSTMALCHPIKDDVKEMLVVLAIAAKSTQKFHPIVISIMKGLGSIFSRDPVCASAAKSLLQKSTQTKSSSSRAISSKTLKPLGNLIQIFEDGQSVDAILFYLKAQENDLFDSESTLSTTQQAGLLMLFGIGLLNSCNGTQRQSIYVFLDKLLLSYPHLGISLLPVIVDGINSSVIRGTGDQMMEEIEFLAGVLVRDPQCAREIWNLLGKEFMRESVPGAIRSSIIRLFPKICGANKRLYKRVVETMGNVLVSSKASSEDNFELRLAVAASTLDLAQSGLIRDPTDVISWLQDFITDTGWVRPISTLHQSEEEHTKESMAYYSILALHSLVVAGELDFKLVLVVLRKRLCDVHDVQEVSMLPPLVLESMILLLGAGECEEEDSSDEEDNRLKAVGVSPQISRSVETLIDLWSHKCLNPERFVDATSKCIMVRCKRNILTSLTKYSFEALGLDEEGIQSVCVAANSETDDKPRALLESGLRYNALKHVISNGIEMLSILNTSDTVLLNNVQKNLNREVAQDFTDSLTGFIGKILNLEEETLGSSLWQKRQSTNSRRNTDTEKSRGSKRPNLSEQLPSPKNVLDAYKENQNQATSLGALLCCNAESTQLLDDLITDATKSFSDDTVQMLYFQAFLNAARSTLCAIVAAGTIVESLDELMSRMQERQLDNPDATLMFLAATGVLIPIILGTHGDYSSYVKDISNILWEAYQARTFDQSDVAKLCLGLLGLCHISLGDGVQTIDVVDCLEKTTAGYGGSSNFGSYYALGIIAQKCAIVGGTKSMEAQSENNMIQLSKRIVLFFFNELSKCMKGTHEAINVLGNCIKSRTVNAEDLAVFAKLQKTTLKVKRSKISTSRSIFIALGICLPRLVSSTEKLLNPIVSFLESLEWHSGNAFCLHPILQESCQRNALGATEIETKYNAYCKSYQEGIEKKADNAYEILYPLMAMPSNTPSQSIEKLRTMEITEAGDSVYFVLAVSSIASMPCLGHGRNRLVTDSPCLLGNATQIDVDNIVQVVSTFSDDMAMIMRGFLASLTNVSAIDQGGNTRTSLADELKGTKLPEAHPGTVSEITMTSVHNCMETRDLIGLVALLRCLDVTALPNQFSVLVETLAKGEETIKFASIKLLVSQIKGRPRAVFDGRDFVKLASKICKMPTASVATFLGNEGAAEIFVDAFGEMMTKFISEDVELVIGNIFEFCISQLDQHPALIVTFLRSLKQILHQAKTDKSPRFSPKCLNSIYVFLQQKAFSDVHKATTGTHGLPPNQVTKIVEVYSDCIALVPDTLLVDSKILHSMEGINFSGECLRIRLFMSLIQNDSHYLLPRSYREITSCVAWITKQLISCEVGIFSTTLLQAACAIAAASSIQVKERRKEIIVSFLDHVVMVDSSASFVCLQILAVFAYQFCRGHGSNGDLSLLRALGPSVEKWVDLPPEMLKKTCKLAVHDLPFNLARITHREGLLDIVCNRLWTIYTKWSGEGANETILNPLRLSLICCKDPRNATNSKNFAELVTCIVSK